MNHSQLYEQRSQRIRTSIALSEPDRVPFMPCLNNYCVYASGLNMREVMLNPLCAEGALRTFMQEFSPDLLNVPGFFPIPPMETSGFSAARWPGPYFGLPDDTPYQYLDRQYLEDEDYDTFLDDPTRFILHKLLPEKHRAFAGLAEIEPYLLCDSAIFAMSVFAQPAVRSALRAMLLTGEQTADYLEKAARLARLAADSGFPIFGTAAVMAPFDEFADHVRGLLPACLDCITNPDRLERALERWGDVTIPARVAQAKAVRAEYVFMPLHCGTDEFMSVQNYERFYWPGLHRAICAILDAGMTPLVFCEGRYHSRLEILRSVPKGKVIFLFEDVDFARAKQVLGNVACIAGGMPTGSLIYETPDQVADQTKRMLDLCAPGGGYIMSNSIALDQASPANMEAWRDTLLTYGVY